MNKHLVLLVTLIGALGGCARVALTQPPGSGSAERAAETAAVHWYRNSVLDRQKSPPAQIVVDPYTRNVSSWGEVRGHAHMAAMATMLKGALSLSHRFCPQDDATACRLQPGLHMVAFGPTVRRGDTVIVNLVTWRGQEATQERHAAGLSSYQFRVLQVAATWSVVKSRRVVGDIDFTIDPWADAGASPPPG